MERSAASVAQCCIRMCMEEIVALRLLCAKQRVLIAKREQGRTRLERTHGKQALDAFTEDERSRMTQLSQAIICVAPRLRAVSAPTARHAVSADIAIRRRQLLVLTASPVGSVTNGFTPDLLAMLLNSLMTALLVSGDINDQLFVMLLLHAECLLTDALYDKDELAKAKEVLGENSESACERNSDVLTHRVATDYVRVPLRQVCVTRVRSHTP